MRFFYAASIAALLWGTGEGVKASFSGLKSVLFPSARSVVSARGGGAAALRTGLSAFLVLLTGAAKGGLAPIF
ncbi:MAG: hypothetical protein IJ244_00655 [Bacteroidaceae bacterium]|nr:hypothetical protein [Bacteroidaceae bacterium]